MLFPEAPHHNLLLTSLIGHIKVALSALDVHEANKATLGNIIETLSEQLDVSHPVRSYAILPIRSRLFHSSASVVYIFSHYICRFIVHSWIAPWCYPTKMLKELFHHHCGGRNLR